MPSICQIETDPVKERTNESTQKVVWSSRVGRTLFHGLNKRFKCNAHVVQRLLQYAKNDEPQFFFGFARNRWSLMYAHAQIEFYP